MVICVPVTVRVLPVTVPADGDGLVAFAVAVVDRRQGKDRGPASLSPGDGERRDGPRRVVGGHGCGVVGAPEGEGHDEVVGQRVRVELRGHDERGRARVLGDLGGLDAEVDGRGGGLGEDFEGEVGGLGQGVAAVVVVEYVARL